MLTIVLLIAVLGLIGLAIWKRNAIETYVETELNAAREMALADWRRLAARVSSLEGKAPATPAALDPASASQAASVFGSQDPMIDPATPVAEDKPVV